MAEQGTPSKPGLWRSLLSGIAVVPVLVFAWLWWFGFPGHTTAEDLLAESRRERDLGNSAVAEALALRALQLNPLSQEAAWLAGECAADQQAWPRALKSYQQASSGAGTIDRNARLQSAEILHHHLDRLRDAERAYRAVLVLDPDNVTANAGLAKLLTLCGRVSEARPHVLRLIRQGVEPDLLVLLVRRDVTLNDPDALNRARKADPSDPNPLIGLAWHALQQGHLPKTEDLLSQALERDRENVPARVLRGRLLLESGRSNEFAAWSESLSGDAGNEAEVWQIRGQMAEAVDDRPGAIRCFWESLRRGPESKPATLRLIHNLSAVGESQTAARLRERVERMTELEEAQTRTLFTADHGRPELLLPLARAYERAGRLWEAYAWSRFALEIGLQDPQGQTYVTDLRFRLNDEPLELVTRSANVALTLDLSHYPIPRLYGDSAPVLPVTASGGPPGFRDDADALGLAFRYFHGTAGPMTHRMFELTGGGIGVFDFDLDDAPDLFLSQGRAWPPGSPDPSGGDRIFRNAGLAFEDVTRQAGLAEDGFGQGVAVGDFNADGFPDVYVGNIGRNRLWVNCGDGTVQDVTEEARILEEAWTTSTLLADLTGDGLPDIYDVNYLTAPDVFDRVCRHADGSPKQCLPQDFEGAPDRLWENLGNGQFRDATGTVLGEVPAGMGLGIAAWDAGDHGRLSVFVANDTTRSFLFQPAVADAGKLVERGIEAGVAFNDSGKATACMGVAVGDADGDGRMDLHITNFASEPNTLFLNTLPGYFEDQTRRAGLETPSFAMLGFGTQFLDGDLDGRLELFVSNGHVDDLTRQGKRYRMRPQMFQGDGRGRFVEVSRAKLGPYFEKTWVGRAAARLDWNRDGREDLIVGHLHDPVALLTNTTAEIGGHLSLQLIGVQSNRDAVGTTVEARIGLRTLVRQVTAGDGYQCSNERRLIFGTGAATQVDDLTIRWPSGLVQRFENVAVPARQKLCEGEGLVGLGSRDAGLSTRY